MNCSSTQFNYLFNILLTGFRKRQENMKLIQQAELTEGALEKFLPTSEVKYCLVSSL